MGTSKYRHALFVLVDIWKKKHKTSFLVKFTFLGFWTKNSSSFLYVLYVSKNISLFLIISPQPQLKPSHKNHLKIYRQTVTWKLRLKRTVATDEYIHKYDHLLKTPSFSVDIKYNYTMTITGPGEKCVNKKGQPVFFFGGNWQRSDRQLSVQDVYDYIKRI